MIESNNVARRSQSRIIAVLAAGTLALGLAIGAAPAAAQTANFYGSLANFDVYNTTGEETCGFEIEIPGATSGAGIYTYPNARYGDGVPKVTATGVSIFYMAQWDPATSSYKIANGWAGSLPACTAMAGKPSPTDGHSCVMSVNGCEHFGAWSPSYSTRANYYWLVKDPANPGSLKRYGSMVAIPSPVWTPVEPAVVGQDPVMVAEIVAPEPAEVVGQFGKAQWIKVFKAKLNRGVALGELLSDNPIVPQNADQVEVSWDLMQDQPPSGGNQKRKRKQGSDNVNVDVRAIVRRYETYQYTGAYDPITNEALCADLTCTAPADGELGDYIGAQMAAANFQVNGIKITRVGAGSVSSGAPKFDCGVTCTVSVKKDSVVTLTAKPSSGAAFVGWSGACAGTALTCSLTVSNEIDVGAKFATLYTLSVTGTNKGTVIADAGGINCGKTCSGKVAEGTKVTLTAVPLAGQTFLGWSGGCTGTAKTCSVIMSKGLSVTGSFSK